MFLTGRKLGRIDLTPPGGTSYAKEQSNTNVMQYYSLQILHLKKPFLGNETSFLFSCRVMYTNSTPRFEIRYVYVL